MEMKNAEASLVMEKEVYVAAMKGDVNFLEKTQSNEYLLRKTHEKNSILHIAIQNQRLEFIATILRRFPQNRALICGKNSQQNTPLHIAAVVGNKYVVSRIYDDLEEIAEGDDEDKPWRLKNSKGNTPAHEALVHGNVYVAMFFFCRDSQLALIVNDSKEALLHLAVKHRINYSAESESIKSKIKEGETSSGTNCEGVENRSMIEFLVEKACYVTCWADVNGLTPLHSAASLIIPYNLQIIRFIIEHCPQSTEVCDNSGKSILHLLINRVPNYQEAKNLLNIGEIYQLRNCQDYQGDTPLHIAASNMDIDMVKVLQEFGSNQNIKNVQGISPTTIIQQNGILQMVEERRMRKEECEAANRGDIEFLRERMSMVGDDFLQSKDTDGKNFLHILFNIRYVDSMLEEGFNGFIEQVVCRDVSLVIQGENYKGNTPIHVLARLSNRDLLYTCHQNILLYMQQQPTIEGLGLIYIMQNADGNTPLHEALLSSPDDALDLRFGSSTRLGDSIVLPTEGNVTISDKTAVNLLDYHHTIASHLTQTFGCETKDWPEDVMPFEYKFIAFLFLFLGNIKGNTVLHLAIQNKHFQFIQKVFDIYEDFPSFPVLFEVVNKDGETPAYLLGEMETIHPDVEQKILRHPKLRGIRSIWGIPKTQLQNYMGSMNVIAALLATITFTAAFTVPGGLNQDKGTPILINSKAFSQFLLFDVVAMCLSMMVLLCLLWIMASNKRDSVKTQDLAVALLLAAFIATIITFICGVYATLHPVNPNMAKGTVYLCLALILSVLPFILSKAIYPFKNIIRYYFRIIKRSTMWKTSATYMIPSS